jgi:5'-nucleotidase
MWTTGGLKHTFVTKRCGYKIGFIGIIERDWVTTFKDLEVDLEYLNYKRHAALLAKQLRENEQCDFVFALAHMRMNHDVKLAEQVEGIDLVLGGHDHFYKVEPLTTKYNPDKVVTVVKSGSDFEDFSVVTLLFD